jgi:iron complex outermembrane receptor protein
MNVLKTADALAGGSADAPLARLVSCLLLSLSAYARAEEDIIELDEMTITGQAMTETLSAKTLDEAGLAREQATASDATDLLKDIPGVSVYTGGGVSNLPVIHGMADDRVNVQVNGMTLTSACSNHMNPALSYVAPTQVGKATVMAGITPVSQGGDSIAGTISVDPLAPEFATEEQGTTHKNQVGQFFRSVNDNFGVSASGDFATRNWRVDYNGAWSKAINYLQGGDENVRVLPTEFESSNANVRVSTQQDSGLWTAGLSGQHIPYQGFPNQRMDMTLNDALIGDLNYENNYDWGKLDGKIYYHYVRHRMDSLPSRDTAPMPMDSVGQDAGYRLRAEIPMDDRQKFHIGNEYFMYRLNDWWPGRKFNPQDFISVNQGSRNRMGTFAEWQMDWDREWTSILGGRNDTLWMNAGNVHGYNDDPINTYWSSQFNTQDHARTFVNFDLTAMTSYTPNAASTYELGFARKQRAPNLYELYAWTGGPEKSMINWFGDGNGYQGNLNLKSETAYNFTFSANFHDDEQKIWNIDLSPYYTHVDDYIFGQVQSIQADGFRGMRFVNLPYAYLFGGDATGRYVVVPDSDQGSFALKATVAYVRGVGKDGMRGQPCPYADAFQGGQFVCQATGWSPEGEQAPNMVNLYHMMPVHGTVALEHQIVTDWGEFNNYLGVDLVDRKTVVATTYNEPQTPGYALLNIRSTYRFKQLTLNLGVDNLLNKLYYNPLGGVYIYGTRFPYSPDSLPPVPAMGR